jgi:hypothetical protein
LDTFGLSGVVAATAFASGMPTVFFKDSRSFIEFYERHLDDAMSLPRDAILAPTIDQYVDIVISLMRDASYYTARSTAQVSFADGVLFKEKRMYDAHLECLRKIICRVSGGATTHG